MLPNILITGTPGCGKTQHCERLKELLNFNFINVSALVAAKGLDEGRDEELDTLIIDEDRLLDELEGPIAQGGVIVDHHSCAFFPERFFQLVVVLRADNGVLYERLEARGYSERKLSENVEAEIMQVVKDEALESYDESIVVELTSDTEEQLESNCQRILAWISAYMKTQREQGVPAVHPSARRMGADEEEDDDEDEA